MTIKTDAWHYRVYAYWTRFSLTYKESYQENLCHYMRVLLLWAPLLRASRALRLQGLPRPTWMWFNNAVFVLAWTFLFIRFGWLSVLLWLASVVGAVLILILLVTIAVVIFGDRKPPEIPGTVRLVGAYVIARKRRVCPFISFAE